MITVYTMPDCTPYPVEIFKFPGGEVNIRLHKDTPDTSKDASLYYMISAYDVASSDDVMAILLVTDALKRLSLNGIRMAFKSVLIGLSLMYAPYARQDRVCSPGEALSAKVFADLINSQGYERVVIADPHSDVIAALINNCHVISLEECFKQIGAKDFYNGVVLVAPDAGANKKVFALAKSIGTDFVRADKIRDTKTGEITGTQVYTDHVGERPMIVVDDICDGGRTFVELGKVLRTKTNGPLILYITHGIFSNGFDELLKYYSEIWVFNPFPRHLPPNVYTSNFGKIKINR